MRGGPGSFDPGRIGYTDVTPERLIIRGSVATAINGLSDFLAIERKRAPGNVLHEAESLECLLFGGYDPHFEGDEPRGL
jgi:hypothetical protein